MFTQFQNQIWLFIYSFFFPFTSNKTVKKCFDTLSDELNMQTSRLPRRLMDYITYGFFESNKNRANQKSASNTKQKKKEFQSAMEGIVRDEERSLPPPLFAGSMSAPLR